MEMDVNLEGKAKMATTINSSQPTNNNLADWPTTSFDGQSMTASAPSDKKTPDKHGGRYKYDR